MKKPKKVRTWHDVRSEHAKRVVGEALASQKKTAAQLDREIQAVLEAGPAGQQRIIPDKGYLIGYHGGSYVASFGSKHDAIGAARSLAKRTNQIIDVIKVENRGNDRSVIDEVFP